MPEFLPAYLAITGHPPFRWQTRLFERLIRGEVPQRCDLPTGLGKTSVIAIWLIALASQLAKERRPRLPRRLVYVVDRRAIVDQATEEVQHICEHINSAPELAELRKALVATAAVLDASNPLGVTTLRGGMADNDAWFSDPARPSVIVGTVDMIGSRLLFSGYRRVGRYSRSLQAGLLAQDSLIVVDEAHLCPAFVETLSAMRTHVTHSRCLLPFHVMLLTATQPLLFSEDTSVQPDSAHTFAFNHDEDLRDAIVRNRFEAKKTLRFIGPSSRGEPKPEEHGGVIAEEAMRVAGDSNAVVIFVETIKLVEAIAKALRAHAVSNEQMLRFTSEIRGAERDALDEHPVLKVFTTPRSDHVGAHRPHFLIATAAAEVGLNFDADHAVCDLVPLERMIQRFGRVNRFGDGDAQISVALSTKLNAADTSCLDATYHVLHQLPPNNGGIDVSPAKLRPPFISQGAAQRAFTPASPPPPLDVARLDDWSMTALSPKEFPRPQVSYWLRGITPDSSAETWLAWREDLQFAADAADASEMAQAIPLQVAELIRVSTLRAADFLGKLRKRIPTALLACLTSGGEWRGIQAGDVPEKADARFSSLLGATIILPTNAGGLDKEGHLAPDSDLAVRDVLPTDRFRRVLFTSTSEDGWEAALLPEKSERVLLGSDQLATTSAGILAVLNAAGMQLSGDLKLRHFSGEPDDSADQLSASKHRSWRVAYFECTSFLADDDELEDAASLGAPITVDDHTADVVAAAQRLVERLDLPPQIADAIVEAAKHHDSGKKRELWQRAIGNLGEQPLAKSNGRRFDPHILQGFRHEFASMLDAAHTLKDHPQRELILHLIATHHGHGRPGFSGKAFDPQHLPSFCEQAAREAERRFARLQREFGWWQLAFLEALLKRADGIASAGLPIASP